MKSTFRPRYIVLLLFLGALCLRLIRLGTQSLWLDEGGTWNEITSKSWLALLGELFNPRQGYPLYHLLMKTWVVIAGDSEWALRLPSAIAGALTVALTFELGRRLYEQRVGMAAAMLLMLNPFALWQAQDAKAYSLLMLAVVWSLLTLVRALESPSRSRWIHWILSVIVLLMLHRFALFLVIGQVAMVGWFAPLPARSLWLGKLAPVLLMLGLALGLIFGLQQDPNAPPIGATINPFTALQILATRLLFDKTPDAVPLFGLIMVIMLVAGIATYKEQRAKSKEQNTEQRTQNIEHRGKQQAASSKQQQQASSAGTLPKDTLARTLVQGKEQRATRILWLVGGLPVVLYVLALAFKQPIFEPRYVSFALPLYVIWLATSVQSAKAIFGFLPVGLIVLLQVFALFSKPYGLWSGNAVKEDYRGAITTLASKLTPDDVVAVHPPYISTLYRYYAPRVSPDPLPQPVAFGRAGALGYNQGEFDNDYAGLLANKKRAWLLIAPDNAKAIDPPNPQFPQDDMGKVGINFLTADMNDKWRCLDQQWLGFNGLRILCQSFPKPLQAGSLELKGAWQIPSSLTATWNSIELQGYTIQQWQSNEYHAGGTLPIELFWRTTAPISTDYRLFVHLVPALGAPVAAQLDTAPLNGGLPTSRWQPNQPIHDEIAVPLPRDMLAGEYLVVLGWYDPTISDIATQRLKVTNSTAPAHETLIELGKVRIMK